MIIRLVMANDRCNFYFSFWVTFWRFVPLTTKIKKKNKRKIKGNTWRYHHFETKLFTIEVYLKYKNTLNKNIFNLFI